MTKMWHNLVGKIMEKRASHASKVMRKHAAWHKKHNPNP